MSVSRTNRKKRQPAQAERVGQLQPVALHLRGVQVVQHVVHRRERAVARRVLVALAVDRARTEDRLPDLGLAESVARSSPGLGGFVFATVASLPLAHASAACEAGTSAMARRPPGALGQSRIVQRVGGAPVHAHGASRAGVVVDDEDRVRAGDLGARRRPRRCPGRCRSTSSRCSSTGRRPRTRGTGCSCRGRASGAWATSRPGRATPRRRPPRRSRRGCRPRSW